MHSALDLPATSVEAVTLDDSHQPPSPGLLHVLSPKFISTKARPLGKTENRAGRLILFVSVGGIFWLFVFGLLYRLLRYFRGIPEIGALLAAKLLGLMFVSLFGILILSNVVTALSSFFLAKDLDLLVAAPVDWLRLYGAKLLETTAHSSWMVVLVATPVLTAYGISYQGGFLYPLITIVAVLPFLFIPAAIVIRGYFSGEADPGHSERHRCARGGRRSTDFPIGAPRAPCAPRRLPLARRVHLSSPHTDFAVDAE
jgi:hypothetical protein